jgi:hypothetical protein
MRAPYLYMYVDLHDTDQEHISNTLATHKEHVSNRLVTR